MARKSNNTCLNVLASNLNSNLLDNKLSKEVTFVAGTTGAVATKPIVTVTGVVALSIFAVNTGASTVTGATATIEVGTEISTAGLLPTLIATTWASREIWHDATTDNSIELSSVIKQYIVTQSVSYTIKVAAITDGTVTFFIAWTPISPDGNVILA
jgi:hypothetical protein